MFLFSLWIKRESLTNRTKPKYYVYDGNFEKKKTFGDVEGKQKVCFVIVVFF